MLPVEPSFAVLLAAFNGIDYIEQQVNSILEQKKVRVTIYISVDVSDDDTYGWCKQACINNTAIRLLPYGERFGGAAANFFRLIRDVDFTCYDYVAFADQDDIWLEDKLRTAADKIIEFNAEAYSCNVLAFWENGKQCLIDKAQPFRDYDYLFEAAGPGCTYVVTTKSLVSFKLQLVEQKQLVDKISLHDWLIYAFYRAVGFHWVIDNAYNMLYRQHNSNQVGVNSGFKAIVKRVKLFTNGWYKSQVTYISQFIDQLQPDFTSSWQILRNIGQLRRKFSDRVVLFFLVCLGLYR